MAKKSLTTVVIDALEDIKARDILVVNVSRITSVCDHIAIASADSTRQTKALASNVVKKVKEAGFDVIGQEGENTGEWVLVDCGDMVVHIMQPAVREYYKLEELWLDGKIEFPKPKAAAKSVPAPEEEIKPKRKPAAAKTTTRKPVTRKDVAAGKTTRATTPAPASKAKVTSAAPKTATRKRLATPTAVTDETPAPVVKKRTTSAAASTTTKPRSSARKTPTGVEDKPATSRKRRLPET